MEIVNTITLLIPWTILVLRQNAWALESPVAEIMIASYAVFMILAAGVCVWSYRKAEKRSVWFQVCLVGHGIYAAFAVMVLGMMALQ